jgi:diguanylate cyclase (GGDEF)-like protein/PAS domain S-box-containing protein
MRGARIVRKFWTRSIRHQLVIGIALVHAVLMTIFVFDLVNRQRGFLHEQSQRQTASLASTLAVSSVSWLLADDVAGMQELIQSKSSFPGIRYAMLISPAGRVLAHTDRDRIGLYLTDAGSRALLNAAPRQAVLINSAEVVDIAEPVLANRRLIGWARVAVGQQEIAAGLAVITRDGVFYTLAAIVVGTLFALFMGAGLTRGLQNLVRTADAFRRGERRIRATVDREDEIGRLAEDFNAMLDAVVQREIDQQEKEQLLRLNASVFENTQEGILITDAEQRILRVNSAFTAVTGYTEAEVAGRTPRILKSGRQDAAFYQQMWQAIATTGHWRGEIWNRNKGGELYAEILNVSAVEDGLGRVTNYIGVFSDISDLKAAQRRLEALANFDALTGLPNRALLADRLRQAISTARRQQQLLAVVFLDLDGFKEVNDELGHETGDRLLVEVARRLAGAVRGGDTVARLGGDEFVLLLVGLADMAEMEPVLNRVLTEVAQPYRIEGRELLLSASMGVAVYPVDEADPDTLLRHADQAMYQAKQSGRNRFLFFDPAVDREMQGRHQQLERLRQALRQGEFRLHYQPKVNLRRGEVIGMEALLRWQHPERGLVPPGEFLPLIEQSDLIIQIGEWVLDEALAQVGRWQAVGRSWPVSVNIAARHLQRHGFVERLKDLLAAHPEVPPASLELEVLETAVLEDIEHVRTTIIACQSLGVGVAVDDFGTGYSSLAYLIAGQRPQDRPVLRPRHARRRRGPGDRGGRGQPGRRLPPRHHRRGAGDAGTRRAADASGL